MESIMNIERIITSINEAIGLSLMDDKSADYKLGYARKLRRSACRGYGELFFYLVDNVFYHRGGADGSKARRGYKDKDERKSEIIPLEYKTEQSKQCL